MVSKERIQSRKLLQSVLVSSDSEKARREVFQAAAKAANKVPAGAGEVSENLKKQTPSRSNPIQN
jgi:formiminotetrahydrofolate cyclodeaminase